MNDLTKYYLSFILLMLSHTSLFSQTNDPIQTDRPDLTESPYTVPSGYFQLESGFASIHVSPTKVVNFNPTLLFKYGFSKAFEVRLITDLVSVSDSNYRETVILPMALGLKIAISEEKGVIPKTAFIGHLRTPRGGESEFSSTYFAPSFRFTMQHTLSDRISLSYNLGAEWTGNTAEPIFIYTLTSGISLTNALGVFIELYGYAPQKNKVEHSFDGGFTYLFNDNVMADLSAGFGITENAPDYFISAGFSFRVNTRKKEG